MNFKIAHDKENNLILIINTLLLFAITFSLTFFLAKEKVVYIQTEYEVIVGGILVLDMIIYSILLSVSKKAQNMKEMIISNASLAVSSLPFLIIIMNFAINNISYFGYLFLIKITWGLFIQNLMGALGGVKSMVNRNAVFSAIMILIILGSLFILFISYVHNQMVLTDIYDRDIPFIVFLNPMFTAAGLVMVSAKDYSQMGLQPFYIFEGTYIGLILILNIFARRRGQIGKEDTEKN